MNAEYERNRIFRSTLTGHWYFAPKVRVVGKDIRLVVGRQCDITEQIEPFLLKKWRRKAASHGRRA